MKVMVVCSPNQPFVLEGHGQEKPWPPSHLRKRSGCSANAGKKGGLGGLPDRSRSRAHHPLCRPR